MEKTAQVSLLHPLSRKATFEKNWRETLEYATKHGTLKGINRKLSNWYNRQRKRKDISHQELAKLDEVENFIVRTDGWDEKYCRYVSYRKKTGRLMVPKTDKELSYWTAENRRRYKEGILREERARKLEQVGFIFVKNKPYHKKNRYTALQDRNWNDMYDRLSLYKEEHGSCLVKADGKEDSELINWVSFQRKQNNKGNMDHDRKAKLDSIGFVWIGETYKKET